MTQVLRADAQDNRDRVLEAARSLFADGGLNVPIREIARQAGVGPATLYRRFPTRQALVDEVFREQLVSCRQIVEDGAADPDAWRGFCAVLVGLTSLNVRNQGFVDAFLSTNPSAAAIGAHRRDLLRVIAVLLDRAKQGGSLRSDAEVSDVVLILQAGRGLASLPAASRGRAARRFATLAIDSLSGGKRG